MVPENVGLRLQEFEERGVEVIDTDCKLGVRTLTHFDEDPLEDEVYDLLQNLCLRLNHVDEFLDALHMLLEV